MATPDRIACLFFPDGISEIDLHSLAEACGRFTPQIALRPGEAVFLDLTGTENLFSEEGFQRRLLALSERFACEKAGTSAPRLAIAETASTALASTRFSLARFPLEALQDYASPFARDHELGKRIDKMIALLRALGIRDLREFSELPPAELASRFGKEALEMSARVRGERVPAWPGFHPVPRIFEKALLTESVGEGLEALFFVLKGLLDRAVARLRGRCERAVSLGITLELERWSTVAPTGQVSERGWRIDFALPQGSVREMLPILREKFESSLSKEPLTAPVESLGLEILETVPGRGAQRDFFSKKEEDAEALEGLIARMVQKLGEGSAFFAQPVDRYLPEGAYSRELVFMSGVPGESGLPRATRESPLPPPQRPSRLLNSPDRIFIQGEWISHSDGRRWKLAGWEGPERLSGEWWKGGFSRDYYQIGTTSGERFWVFVDEAGGCFLHGFFD
jgi:protein ImuB